MKTKPYGPPHGPWLLVWSKKHSFRMLYIFALPGRRTLSVGRFNGRFHVGLLKRSPGM